MEFSLLWKYSQNTITGSVIDDDITIFCNKHIDNFNWTSLGSLLRNSLRMDTKSLSFKS